MINVSLTETVQTEIYHADFNLEKKSNLDDLPAEKAVFGVFAIVNGQPVNCRFVGKAVDLRATVKALFENPPDEGMKSFMQGAWVQMIVYRLLPDEGDDVIQAVMKEWSTKYGPKISPDGEYPGYYD